VSGSLEVAGRELGRSLLQLAGSATDVAELERLLARLGWQPPPGVDLAHAFEVDAAELPDLVAAVLEAPEPELQRYLELLAGAAKVLERVTEVASALPTELAAAGEYLAKTHIEQEFGRRLLDELLMQRLETGPLVLVSSLRLLGVVRREGHPRDDSIFQTRHDRAVIAYERLPQLLTEPAETLAAEYGWGTAAFDADRFLATAGQLLAGAGIRAVVDGPTASLLVEAANPGSAAGLGFELRRLATGAADADAGLEILPRAASSHVALPLSETLTLDLAATLDLSSTVSLQLRPSGARVQAGAGVSGSLIVELGYAAAPGATHALLTLPTGIGLRAHELFVELGAQLALNGVDGRIGLGVRGGEFSVAAGAGDGFLAHALPPSIASTFDAVLSWSPKGGLQLEGSASLEVSIPLGIALGPLELDRLGLAIRPAPERVNVDAALDLTVRLGPFTAVIQAIGVRAALRMESGNLGPVDFKPALKPPTGVGLSIDAPAVRGGGFLLFDEDRGRYAGVFELTVVDVVSVKAIALITTKLPDGAPGFALLIMITAEGFTPIPLGFGFQLTGVGGLLALNRSVDADAVRDGLRNGVLDSILFVKDPVANVDRVLSTIERVFPLARDRLLVGPLAEISWGTPPIVKVRLALLLEVPRPVRVIVLAALSAVLPDADHPVVELHIDAIGVLDLGRGELALDASLHDSRLLKFTLTGDMALRLNWGDAPTFLLSVGGFHPRYKPPAGLRKLERLALSLSGSENPKVRFETYLALTSNSIQLGARVTLFAEAAGFGIDGGGAFDALVQWSPFAIDVSFEAWVRIFGPTGTLLAARVAVDVTGPQPWHVTGIAEVHVLFLSVTVGIDFTIGEAAEAPPVEIVDVAGLLWQEVARRAAWQAALPANVAPGVTLGLPAPAADAPLVVHPFATLTVRQRVVPLDKPVARVGSRLPKEGTRTYGLDVTAPTGVRVGQVTDLFAPAQFADLPEDAKLAGQAFTAMPAGLDLRPTDAVAAATDGVLATDLAFETLDVTDLDAVAVPGAAIPAVAASALANVSGPVTDRRARARLEVLPA
jgi:hypothetical protein